MSLKRIAIVALVIASVSQPAMSATVTVKKILCVNGSSQVFARTKCLAAETTFVSAATPTPTPTPTGTARPLDLSSCRRISVSSPSVVGVATTAFQCDLTKEFVLEYGFTTSDGFNSDASVKSQLIQYVTGGTLPVGVSVTMEGSRSRNYNLTVTATCCKK